MFTQFFGRSTVSQVIYLLLILLTSFFVAISCALLLSQAARTAPNRSFIQNFNAVVIGAAYVILVGRPSPVPPPAVSLNQCSPALFRSS